VQLHVPSRAMLAAADVAAYNSRVHLLSWQTVAVVEL